MSLQYINTEGLNSGFHSEMEPAEKRFVTEKKGSFCWVCNLWEYLKHFLFIARYKI